MGTNYGFVDHYYPTVRFKKKEKEMKKILFSVMCLLILGTQSMFAGGEEEAQPVTLTMMHWKGDAAEALAELFSEFETEHPNIDLEVSVLTNYDQAFQTRRAADELADIVMLSNPKDVMETAEMGMLVDLTGEPFMQNVLSGAREYYSVAGKDYFMPFEVAVAVTFYNTATFDRLGLDVPTNYDELIATAEEIKDAGEIAIGWTLADAVNTNFAGWNYMGAILGKDAQPMAKRIFVDKTSTFSEEPAFRTMLERTLAMVEYFPPEATGMNFDSSIQMFAGGDAAMWVAGAWMAGALKTANPDLEYDFMAWPVNDVAEDIYLDSALSGFVLAAKTEEAAEAGKKLLAWMTDPDVAEKMTLTIGSSASPISGVTFPDTPETWIQKSLSRFADNMYPSRMYEQIGVPAEASAWTTGSPNDIIRGYLIDIANGKDVNIDAILAELDEFVENL